MADTMTLEQALIEALIVANDGRVTVTRENCAKWADAIDAAIKQREQDKRDAARYRHMIETSPFMCFGASEYSKKSDLDEAIDNSIAAMAKESGQ
jgi:hypothetical protein